MEMAALSESRVMLIGLKVLDLIDPLWYYSISLR
jgi:hypothetical protein